MTPSEPANRRQHIHYFDPLRLIAAFSVIFMHIASSLLRKGVNVQWELLNVCTGFAFTAVPLFLMMSGFLMLSSEKTMDIPYLLTRRVPRLLAPLGFWTGIAVLQAQLFEHTFTPAAILEGLVQSFHMPALVHFWYMYLLFALYLLSPILCGGLRALDDAGHRYVLALIGAVTVQTMALALLPDAWDKFLAFDIFDKLKLYGGNLCTFVLGFYLGGTRKKFPNWLLAAAAVALLAAIAVGTRALIVSGSKSTQLFQDQSAGFEVALAGCIFLLWKQNFTRPLPRFLAPAVALSLPIYLMHGVLYGVFVHYGIFPHDFPETVGLALLMFLSCFLCTKTAASVKPLCYLTTGMTYADACKSCNWQYTFRTLRGRSGNASMPPRGKRTQKGDHGTHG